MNPKTSLATLLLLVIVCLFLGESAATKLRAQAQSQCTPKYGACTYTSECCAGACHPRIHQCWQPLLGR